VLFASQLLFSNNQVDHFGDDGVDFAASNLAITKNNVHDNVNIGDGNHEDAMQRQIDPALSFPTYLQGISAFDADWTNVKVTNNALVTSGASWGIAFSSIHNG